jgi:hypothetical protein
MPAWYYFDRPSHLAFHDLTTSVSPPKNLRSLLGLGLKFCPTPRFTTYNLNPTLNRFKRDLWLKTFFAGSPLEANDSKMYVKSSWTPPDWNIPWGVRQRFKDFQQHLQPLFRKRRGRHNLLPHQRRALSLLQKSDDLLVVQCDKNLGPAIIEKSTYIGRIFLDHLNDSNIYRYLSAQQLSGFELQLRRLLTDWIERYKGILTKNERQFLRQRLKDSNDDDPFPVLYGTIKIHKTPWTTRPIVSCSGSLLHPLGIWVDRKLQPIARAQRSFFSSSFELKTQLTALRLPPSARLFTADAISMYTNIDTPSALRAIRQHLCGPAADSSNTDMQALCDALRIVMTNNVFTFGDTAWHQLIGTAMGTPPAPPYATIYYALHEETFLDRFASNILFYRRFIDDVIGIWVVTDPDTDDDTFQQFCSIMNDYHSLRWEHGDRSLQVNFMDLTISIRDGRIQTTLYRKALNLYLYIPPHSAHPPGVLNGLVCGIVHRVFTLCSNYQEALQLCKEFYRRLLVRGYKPQTLRPLFTKAASKALAYTGPSHSPLSTSTATISDSIFFHLRYHPNNPSSSQLQHVWKEQLLTPRYKQPLFVIRNKDRAPIGIRRMIVAYNRPPNLGNFLSYRNITVQNGPPVSSYRITDQRGPGEREREREREREQPVVDSRSHSSSFTF